MSAFLRRIFGIGTVSDDFRARFESEGIIEIAANVGVVQRFSGSVPGLHTGPSISRTSGSLVLTSRRVVTTLAIRSDPWAGAVDRGWDDPDAGAMTVDLTPDGIRLGLDVHRVDPRFRGHLSLHYKHGLAEDVLTRLPKTSLRQDVSPEFVLHTLGVRSKAGPSSS